MSPTLPKLEEMQDILDIREFPIWQGTWIKVLLIVLLSTFLLALLWIFLKKFFQRKVPEKILNPLEKAMKQLQDLVHSDLLTHGKVRPFYFALSEIFRDFLAQVLGIHSMEATSAELKALLKEKSPWKEQELRQAFWFLDLSELAKFGQFKPEKEEMIESVKACRTLMESLWQTQNPISN